MEKQEKPSVVFDSCEIARILPHRYPFVMVDKIIEFADNERIVGVKNVTINEEFFEGHFPGRPVMPGVLILEAMAQTAAILAIKSSDGVGEGKTVFLVGAEEIRWKRQVIPGDTLHIEMTSHKKRRPYWMLKGIVRVDGKIVCQGLVSAVEAD